MSDVPGGADRAGALEAVRPPQEPTAVAVNGVQVIERERVRQIVEEGFTADHDDQYCHDELSRAARSYALCAGKDDRLRPPFTWPWDPAWWRPTGDAVKDLAKAGALIAAEIDRLQRLRGEAE